MKLEFDGKIITSVTPEKIREIFWDDFKRGRKVVLRNKKHKFIRISGLMPPYLVECREGSLNKHYEGAHAITKEEAEDAFLKYLKEDPSWKNMFTWKKISYKPWWKFWSD